MELVQNINFEKQEPTKSTETIKPTNLAPAKEMMSRLDEQVKMSGMSFGYDETRKESMKLLENLPNILPRLGIQNAQVSLIEHAGRIAIGASRIPFLIETPSQKLVTKILDPASASNIQIESQEAFQDGLAPKIIEITERYVVEEYIDQNIFPSIDEVARTDGLNSALSKAVPAFVELNKKGYTYKDSIHWMDEIRLRKNTDSLVLVDWGTVEKDSVIELKIPPTNANENALAILSGNWNLLTDETKQWMESMNLSSKRPIEAILPLFSGSYTSCLQHHPEILPQIEQRYRELEVDPEKLVEIIGANVYVLNGIATYLENSRQSNNKWRDVWPYFSKYLDEYVKQYNAINS